MSDPTLRCPSCNIEIKLTESLAAPILDSARKQFQEQLSLKEQEIRVRESALQSERSELAKARESIEEQLTTRMAAERKKIAAEEEARAKLKAQQELETRSRELADLQQLLKDRDAKLAEAQQLQAQFIRKQRELDDAKRELELTVERRVQESITAAREQAKLQAEEELKLKLLEREQTISSMHRQIEELKRRSEQGSQQLQGEVLELELEELLRAKFPFDTIDPVPKGEFGGDLLHRVTTPVGQPAGIILWETKRTKNWSDTWLPKLREDQRSARAELAVIVSHALPQGITSFDLVEGIWVAGPRYALPLALALRSSLIELSLARQAREGQQTKMELVYDYLLGPRFKQRIEAIVEKFTAMQSDLEKERRSMMRLWSKREEQIRLVIDTTVGMYGDLQGIAGQSLQAIEGLELDLLEGDDSEGEAEAVGEALEITAVPGKSA